ncbi:MAG: thioesterase-like protein [Alphaproteobacteria bacterium]|nr:thioesterase-like protein [Alphaproteobacteria bacterium]
MTFAAPIDSHRETVRPEWIDYNGHMNVAYYVMVFDHATDVLFDTIGTGEDYRTRTNRSLFALEMHIGYQREVREGDPLRVTTQLLGHDAKRLHYIHTMYHAVSGFQAATREHLSLHVDLDRKRSSAMPTEVQRRLVALTEAHKDLPIPAEVGSVIGIRP